MDTRLKTLSDKLNDRRLRAAAPQESRELSGAIYTLLFKADFYQNIWDETVLLALQDLIAEQPPHEMHGSKLQYISKRIEQVVAINDLFAALLLLPIEKLPAVVARTADKLGVGQELVLFQTDGTVDRVRRSNSQPQAKLATALEALSQQVPSIADSLNGCFEAVVARQEIGAVPGLFMGSGSGRCYRCVRCCNKARERLERG